MNRSSALPAFRAMYVCRGCGTEIATPSSFRRCPVCGIKWG